VVVLQDQVLDAPERRIRQPRRGEHHVAYDLGVRFQLRGIAYHADKPVYDENVVFVMDNVGHATIIARGTFAVKLPTGTTVIA
jgi:hypothetical protein